MQTVTIRTAEPKDAKNYSDWLKAASTINLVDYKVYEYPAINTVVVEKNGEPILMNSFHPVLMMEALAPKPGLSPMDEARALKQLFDGIKNIAAATGVKEIWFGCSDPRMDVFVQRHGFEKVSFPVYRIKV